MNTRRSFKIICEEGLRPFWSPIQFHIMLSRSWEWKIMTEKIPRHILTNNYFKNFVIEQFDEYISKIYYTS